MRRLLIIAFIVAFEALAADVSGIWTGQIAGRNSSLQDVAFQLVQRGDVLTGKMYGDSGSTAITDGKISNGHVNFTVVIQEQAGNLFNETKLTFNGCLDGNDMLLTREREVAGSTQNRGKQNFGLKRLL